MLILLTICPGLPARTCKRHAIDPGGVSGLRGADGVRLGDASDDGLPDTVTTWEEARAIRVCINSGLSKVRQPVLWS